MYYVSYVFLFYSSSAGANVLKPAKQQQSSHTVHTASPDVHSDVAPPILPPRNYHPEEIITHNSTTELKP